MELENSFTLRPRAGRAKRVNLVIAVGVDRAGNLGVHLIAWQRSAHGNIRYIFQPFEGGEEMVVVVVDDFQSYRAFVVSELQKRSESQVIYEASDGLEAIRLAKEHQPDLILLDVGLPKLNGIEAARQIRKVTPNSKILFVSQERSRDVVGEALSIGHGYFVKSDGELLVAVDAILQGKQFLSVGIRTHDTTSE